MPSQTPPLTEEQLLIKLRRQDKKYNQAVKERKTLAEIRPLYNEFKETLLELQKLRRNR
jgi:hypothetical protein